MSATIERKHPLIAVHWAVLLAGFLTFLMTATAGVAWALGADTVPAILWQPNASLAMLVCLSGWTIQVILTDPTSTVLPNASDSAPPRLNLSQHAFMAWLLVFLVLMGPVVYLLGLDWKDQKNRAHSLLAFFTALLLLCMPLVPGPRGWVSPLAAGLAWAAGLL